MHREIDASIQQGLFYFLREQAFATFFRQWAVLDRVASGTNDNKLNRALICPERAASRERTVRACTNASGLPRVPMRKEAVDCVI